MEHNTATTDRGETWPADLNPEVRHILRRTELAYQCLVLSCAGAVVLISLRLLGLWTL